MYDMLILFLLGAVLAPLSIVIGSMTSVYLIAMQILFPGLTLGNIIGADKFASIGKGVGAFSSFWSEIDFPFVLRTAPMFIVGGILGATLVSEIPLDFIVWLLIVAFFIAEFASFFSKFFTQKMFLLFEGFLGFYIAILGASCKVILLSIFRLKIPEDDKIIYLKIQIHVIVFCVVVVAAITHYFHGNLLPHIIFPLAGGYLVGGFIGGIILKKTGKLPGEIQKNIMRLSFIFAIIASIYMVYFQ